MTEIFSLDIDEDGCISKQKLAICVAGLLYEMACVDGVFHKKEYEEIIRSLVLSYDIKDDNAAEALDVVSFMRSEKDKVDEFIEALNSVYSESQREHVYSLLLEVAIADGIVDPAEIDLAHHIRNKLELPEM